MTEADRTQVAANYDRLAEQYARHVYAELSGKPFDRELLDRFAEHVGPGRVCDVGCGPGHVTRYLHDRGAEVFGVDISGRMIDRARALNPGIEFEVADLRALPVQDGSLAGVVAFYSLIHLESSELASALASLGRRLQPGGRILVAVHEGRESRAPGEMWGIPVELRFNFFSYEQLKQALLDADLEVEQITHRPPYVGVEAETDRLYATAVAPRAS
jgi:SAM-dependent methyltransferase